MAGHARCAAFVEEMAVEVISLSNVRDYDYYCNSPYRRAEGMRSGATAVGGGWVFMPRVRGISRAFFVVVSPLVVSPKVLRRHPTE